MLGQITDIGRGASLKKTDIKQAHKGLKNSEVLDFNLLEKFHGSTELSENNAKLWTILLELQKVSILKLDK